MAEINLPFSGQVSSTDTAFSIQNTQPEPGGEAIRGTSSGQHGAVVGVNTGDGHGVFGISAGGQGVHGESSSENGGVVGVNNAGPAIYGINTQNRNAIVGIAQDPALTVPNVPQQDAGIGVLGISTLGEGVHGESSSAHGGVTGVNNSDGYGVYGISATGEGVHGETNGTEHAAVVGVSTGTADAGYFKGNVTVDGGDIRLLGGQDCAEEFDIQSENIEPGTVMVLNQSGNLEECNDAYDKKVAGVISGGGRFKPGIILGKQESESKRLPVALMGKVYCKVDATSSSIEIGDLLTTSPTKGHAMKAEDPYKAFGAVIGKALGPIKERLGMIPVLVALQ
jgi:hypothetical protein